MPRVVGLRNLEIVEPTGSPLSKLVVMDVDSRDVEVCMRVSLKAVLSTKFAIKGSHLHT